MWWVVGEFDTLFDVALETFICGLEKLFFLGIDVAEWVVCLFGTIWLGRKVSIDELSVRYLDLLQAQLGQKSSPILSCS